MDWSTPSGVAELGAGTGKLTELLIARGIDVRAVDPDPRMLAVLGRNNPAASCHVSDSTRIPVEDASMDAVLVADAWHWFDPQATVAEVRRVLRPDAHLGLVWNVPAEPQEAWERAIADDSAEYDRVSKASPDGLRARLAHLDPDELELRQVEWTWHVTPRQWASYRATTSMAIALPPDERAAAFAETKCTLESIRESRGGERVPMRHIASCVRWRPGRSRAGDRHRRSTDQD